MNSFKKNQIIITALAIMIIVAGYLNFGNKANIEEGQYVFNPDNTLSSDSDVENVEDENVESDINDSEQAAAQNDNTETSAGEAVLVSSNSVQTNYFLQAKIEREQSRALSKELLLEVINNENVGEEQKVKAANDMLELKDRIEKEEAAESMLLAKGFKDIYVRIDNGNVEVVTNAEELSEAQLAQIQDIVSRKTGISAENITITPLKVEN